MPVACTKPQPKTCAPQERLYPSADKDVLAALCAGRFCTVLKCCEREKGGEEREREKREAREKREKREERRERESARARARERRDARARTHTLRHAHTQTTSADNICYGLTGNDSNERAKKCSLPSVSTEKESKREQSV